MFVMCPSGGRSAECCAILTLMVAPRGRALVFLNMGMELSRIACPIPFDRKTIRTILEVFGMY